MCALIALGYVTADEKDLAIFLLVVAVGISSATYLGFQVSQVVNIFIRSCRVNLKKKCLFFFSFVSGESH